MDTFDYRKYLVENNLGPYSKTDKVEEQNMDHDQEDVEHRNATSTDPKWMQEKLEIGLYPGDMGVDVIGDEDDLSDYEIVELPISQLFRNEPKEKMTRPNSIETLKQLVQAIEDEDEIKPILVQKVGNRYKILDGHHRFTATKLAGKDIIKAAIIPDEDIHDVDENGKPIS